MNHPQKDKKVRGEIESILNYAEICGSCLPDNRYDCRYCGGKGFIEVENSVKVEKLLSLFQSQRKQWVEEVEKEIGSFYTEEPQGEYKIIIPIKDWVIIKSKLLKEEK